MKRKLAFLALLLPSAAFAEGGPPTTPPADIVVLGEGLPLPPDTPAYGISLIDRDRLENSAFCGSRDSAMLKGSFSPNVGSGYVSIGGQYDRGDGFYTTPVGQRGPATARARYEDWSSSIRAVAPIDADIEIQTRALVYRDNRTLRFKGADSSTQANDASIRLVHRGGWAIDPAQSLRHSASATLAWHPRAGPSLSATIRHVAMQYEDDLETDMLPAATIVDGVVSVPGSLFGETVVTRNQGGSIDLGTPRTLWVGFRFPG